jgi:uncharacterized protein YukE
VPDYDYEHLTLDKNDRSQNTATDIEGYPLDVTLQEGWPGTSADPHQVRYNPAKMREVADWLDQTANDLQGMPGRLNEVAGKANYGPDTWNEARHLGDASKQVLTAVVGYSNEILTNLHAAAQSIRTAADKYDGGESANEQSIANQQRTVPDTGAPQTPAY